MKRLTADMARRINTPGLYRADPTLYLLVNKGGSKNWIQRVSINGRRRDMGLGGFPTITLGKAREIALANRVALSQGVDPFAAIREAKAEAIREAKTPTFAEAFEAVYKAKLPTWRSPVTARKFRSGMVLYALPRLGERRIDTIGRGDVLAVLTPIWADKAETARHLRQNMSAVFRWARSHGHCSDNPAGEAISGALPTMPKTKAHHRALPYNDLADALATIDATGAGLASKYALRFVVLTACRSAEVREARWSEIEGDVWRIPGERYKTGREHRVPLSQAALDVLEQARMLDDGSGLIFPSAVRRGRPLSDMTLTKLLRDTGLASRATVHGFRSTFRDWCGDTGKAREIAEAALGHVVGGVEGAYFRSDLFDRRAVLMAQWAAFVTGAEATVVRLHA